MKIAIIGHGKMGQQIEQIAIQRGHTIAAILTEENTDIQLLKNCDVAIEFTAPSSAVNNICSCADIQLPIVVGTTGWYEQYQYVCDYIEKNNGTLLAATNFSLGVNITFFLNQIAARIMQHYPYSVGIQEIHHTQKLDAPSGTAISLGQGIIDNNVHFQSWEISKEPRHAFGNILPIEALRQNDVPGTHTVHYKNDIDSIEITHTAFNRKGFASGAVDAAEWLVGRKGVCKLEEMFNFEQYL